MTDFNEILSDIAAFADDDEDVVIDRDGGCLFVRGGKETQLRFSQADDKMFVEVEGNQIPYTKFLTHHLAKLDILAERILAKREPVVPYVDGSVLLKSSGMDEKEYTALEALERQTRTSPAFLSRVVFMTADAGQGKTASLKEYQQVQAKRFLEGQANSLFWHVDLQGRQLLRLSEALMGDLGDLRVSGLWMPAIIRLLRRGSVVLAIDGFDELAAEQGGTDALGALALLVHQLEGQGTIVAASRRTFFDTNDYIRRAGMFTRAASDCEFNEIRLEEWGQENGLEFMRAVRHEGRGFPAPERTYDEIVSELGSQTHPILTRPFLLAQVSRGLLRYEVPVADFIRGMHDPLKGVGTVIEAFVNREITEKWKQPETGEPFLTKEQHLRLLADVAEEMFLAQRSTISVDVLETLTSILLDEWRIEPARRQQVLEMVRMHVLLTPPDDSEFGERSFDHEEFRDWFTAYALKDRLLRLGEDGATRSQDILSIAHLPDATARYVCSLFERTPELVTSILQGLSRIVREEWRQTYLQANAGTIIPFLLDGIQPNERLEIDADVVFGSVVHENKKLQDVTFRTAVFSNASLGGVTWSNVELVNSNLGELSLNEESEFRNVRFIDCEIDGIRLMGDDASDELREYSPPRIARLLKKYGIELVDTSKKVAVTEVDTPDGELRKLARRLLNTFRRTTFVMDETLQQRFRGDTKRVKEELIPFMSKLEILEKRPWRGRGRHDAWGLVRPLEEVERGTVIPVTHLRAFGNQLIEPMPREVSLRNESGGVCFGNGFLDMDLAGGYRLAL